MDYILFGIGTGATLAVIGWILRGLGPRLRDRQPPDGEILGARDLINRMSWSRFCNSCGMALIIGGMLLLLATGIVAFWNPGDTTASQIMLGLYGLVALLMMVWAGLYTRQFGTTGIYRPADPATKRAREAMKTQSKPTPVAVVETEEHPVEASKDDDSAETENIEGETPPDEVVPDPPIEQVAAQRGGLGRFGAFFSGNKSGQPSPEIAESLELVEDDTLSTDDDIAEVTDSKAIDTDAPPEEGDPSSETDEDLDVSQGDDLPGTDETDDLDSASEPVVAASSVPETVAPNPEEEALAVLRRGRLARLSGTGSDQP